MSYLTGYSKWRVTGECPECGEAAIIDGTNELGGGWIDKSTTCEHYEDVDGDEIVWTTGERTAWKDGDPNEPDYDTEDDER